MLGVERLEHLADRAALDLGRVAPPAASRSWVGSLTVTAIRPPTSAGANAASNSSIDGAISVTSNVPRTVSSVFRPSPVM